ncbi:MAG: hypothetical protein WD534_18160 [Phycisphaeraceae bacterium]
MTEETLKDHVANEQAGGVEEGSEATHPKEKPQSEANDDESRQPKPKRGKSYGKGFIYLHLKDADEGLRLIDSHAKRMSLEGFAVALGHKKPVPRFFSKLDALKEYGLIEDYKGANCVVLTPLAIEMLYGGSEAARTKARKAAFLKYEDFYQTFAECPKNQNQSLDIVRQFVQAKLGIRNDVDRYLRLFLESAKFAGLLEGDPDPTAETIKLKPVDHSPATPTDTPTTSNGSSGPNYSALPEETTGEMLDSLGLSEYSGRACIEQHAAGKVSLRFSDGECVLEIDRPLRVSIGQADAISDLPRIIKCLKEKGYDL